MVKTAYMLDQPRRTDALKRFIDQQLFPATIDAAAGVENIIENFVVRVSRRPLSSLGAAFACGTLVFMLGQAMRRIPAESFRRSR